MSVGLQVIEELIYRYKEGAVIKRTLLCFEFTDSNECFYVELNRDKCKLVENTETYKAKLITTTTILEELIKGKRKLSTEINKGGVVFDGDFITVMNVNKYFNLTPPVMIEKEQPSMIVLLYQWVFLWVVVPIDTSWAAYLSILTIAVMPLLFYKRRYTIYDRISALCIAVLSLLCLLHVDATVVICSSLLLLGMMWFASCFCKFSISSIYTCNNYGGEDALDNIIFLKLHKNISFAWGVFCIYLATVTYFLMQTKIAPYTGLINNIWPALMIAFTFFMLKYYPKSMMNKIVKKNESNHFHHPFS